MPLISMVAPNFVIIFIAAFSSLLLPKLSMIVVPGVRSAAAQARCIELLEGGTFIFPEIEEGVIVIFTFKIVLRILRFGIIRFCIQVKKLQSSEKNISCKSFKEIFFTDAFPISSSTIKFISLPAFFLS